MKVLLGFGLNEDGQCGTSVRKDKEVGVPTIIKFPTRTQIVGISAGSRHSLAICSDGFVYSWGWGLAGQLGHGDNISLSHPLRIPSLQNISQIAAGGMHSGCVSSSNVCYMWGDNSQGQLGIGEKEKTVIYQPTPLRLLTEQGDHSQNLFEVNCISCGGMHSAAVTLSGDIYCWGKSDSGQTGFSTWYLGFSTNIYSPRKVEELSGMIIDVACGGFYTLALTDSGQVYAFGKDDFGCLGIGSAETHDIMQEGPVLLQSLAETNIKQLTAGGWHSMFLSDDGKLYSCGKGEYGRLGLGQEASKLLPTPVTLSLNQNEIKEIRQVSAGGSHSLWFDKNSHVYTVGRLDGGRCGIGTISTGRSTLGNDITQHFPFRDFLVLEVAAGGSHSLVLTETSTPLEDHHLIHCSSPHISKMFGVSNMSR